MKKRCTVCGLKTEDWEIVNGGPVTCWGCGATIREADRRTLKEIERVKKLLQNAQWYVADFHHELITYDKDLMFVARTDFRVLETAVARQFYCDDVDLEFAESSTKPRLILHLHFIPDENDDLDTVDTMNVDTDHLLAFFYLRTYIKEQKLKVKLSPQTQKRWRKTFAAAAKDLQKISKSKTFTL